MTAIEHVLKDAYKRRLIDRLPLLDDAKLKGAKPQRSYLQPLEMAAVLIAAKRIEERHPGVEARKLAYIESHRDVSATALARVLHLSAVTVGKVRRGVWGTTPPPRNRNDVPRVAIIKALMLLGPRVAELCGWIGDDISLAGRRARVRRAVTKTDAGERSIPMLPAVRDELIAHQEAWPYDRTDPVFGTRNGTVNTPGNIGKRVLGPVLAEANTVLAEQGLPPIANLSPHTLRRTFASILGASGVDIQQSVALLGHSDARMTVGVYQHRLKLGTENVDVLEKVMGCTRAEAKDLFESAETEASGLRTISGQREASPASALSALLTSV